MYSNVVVRKTPRLIGELGTASGRFNVTDFKYYKGAEIFGEAEPAEYIYQVIEGAVRTHNPTARNCDSSGIPKSVKF